MAVGYVKEINGELTPVVTAGTSCGKVNKQEYACDKNYAIALTENTGGEGYLGITCCCPLLYNPATGKLSVCYVDACSEYARVTECVKLRESSNNVDYPVPFTCYANAETCQPIYVGGSITYNPASCTLTTSCFCGTATCATDALRAQLHYRCATIVSHDFDVSLANDVTTTNAYEYVSDACRLRYCNVTGALRITNNAGTTLAGSVQACKVIATDVCVSNTIWGETICAGEGGIETYYDVVGYCNDNDRTETWYIYCDGSACFNGEIQAYQGTFAEVFTHNLTVGGSIENSCSDGLSIGYHASTGICCNVKWSSIITSDSACYGRHGKISVTIPSYNAVCHTWLGMRHIITNVINSSRCTCTWTTSTTQNIPSARFAVYGYSWNDSNTASGCKRYSLGLNALNSLNTSGYINVGSAACSSLSICQLLYTCCCNICLNGVFDLASANPNACVCGAQLEIVF